MDHERDSYTGGHTNESWFNRSLISLENPFIRGCRVLGFLRGRELCLLLAPAVALFVSPSHYEPTHYSVRDDVFVRRQEQAQLYSHPHVCIHLMYVDMWISICLAIYVLHHQLKTCFGSNVEASSHWSLNLFSFAKAFVMYIE